MSKSDTRTAFEDVEAAIALLEAPGKSNAGVNAELALQRLYGASTYLRMRMLEESRETPAE